MMTTRSSKNVHTGNFSGSLNTTFGSSSLPAARRDDWILSLSSSFIRGVKLPVSSDLTTAVAKLVSIPCPTGGSTF